MNFDYPDLDSSVHAVFDTQLPGAAIDPTNTQYSQEAPVDTRFGDQPPASHCAENAPTSDCPSFVLFGVSEDPTQELIFPPTIGSKNKFMLPEPTRCLPYLMHITTTLPKRLRIYPIGFKTLRPPYTIARPG